MVIIAATLYLPQHIAFLTNRAWFYYNGPETIKAAVPSPDNVIMTQTVAIGNAMTTDTGGIKFESVTRSVIETSREL